MYAYLKRNVTYDTTLFLFLLVFHNLLKTLKINVALKVNIHNQNDINYLV